MNLGCVGEFRINSGRIYFRDFTLLLLHWLMEIKQTQLAASDSLQTGADEHRSSLSQRPHESRDQQRQNVPPETLVQTFSLSLGLWATQSEPPEPVQNQYEFRTRWKIHWSCWKMWMYEWWCITMSHKLWEKVLDWLFYKELIPGSGISIRYWHW